MDKYVGDGIGWIDPFAGNNSPAEFTNDGHPDRKAVYHMDSDVFAEYICEHVQEQFNGVLFDPPYSYRQVSEHYKQLGRKARAIDTSSNFYNRVMNALCDHVKPGGYAISFGWNTNAFGKNRGFEIVEIMIVAHGGHHNDTLVTVERKLATPGRAGKAGEQQQDGAVTADECEFFSQDYCCPPDYIVKAGFVCSDALPIQTGDITNKCGGSNDKLMTVEEWEESQKRSGAP